MILRVGLTGSIGMGKSQTAELFAEQGLPVYDADAEVHRLYGPGGAAVPLIREAFPEAVVEGRVDRQKLAAVVLSDPEALRRLERLIHPLVHRAEQEAVARAEREGADMIVLDIPLLFEKKREGEVDVIVVVSAPADVQRQRVLERPGMTADKFEAILSKQVPDAEKRRRADFVIETDQGLDHARAQVRNVIAALRRRHRGQT